MVFLELLEVLRDCREIPLLVTRAGPGYGILLVFYNSASVPDDEDR
jgi:hypothetical protein